MVFGDATATALELWFEDFSVASILTILVYIPFTTLLSRVAYSRILDWYVGFDRPLIVWLAIMSSL